MRNVFCPEKVDYCHINNTFAQAKIDLAIAPLNGEAEWIHLQPHEEVIPSRVRTFYYNVCSFYGLILLIF